MAPRRIAVLGLGRSGLAVLQAARQLGYPAKGYDSKPDLHRSIVAAKEAGFQAEGGRTAPFELSEADVLVTSPGVPMQASILSESVKNGVEVIGEIEFAFRISKAPIVAITGTNGKSTTTAMTFTALEAAGANAVLCGNIYGSGYEEVPLTEAALKSSKDQILVAEVSSFQLEWVKEFRPRAAAITNITADHLDRYDGSRDSYAATKLRIFEAMTEEDTAVVPESFQPKPSKPRVLTFANQIGPFMQVLGRNFNKSELPFAETHNFLNAQAALLLGAAMLGESALPRLWEGLTRFKPLDNRLELVGERDGIKVINNTMCTNPAAVIASSQSLAGRQHLLIGGKRKGLDFSEVGRYLQETGHRAYLFGADAKQILAQLHISAPIFDTIEEAFLAAGMEAKSGETIMLAPGCASQDQFEDFRHRGEVFKAVAMEWLKR